MDENSDRIKEQLKDEIGNYVRSTVSKVLNIDAQSVRVDREQIDEILR